MQSDPHTRANRCIPVGTLETRGVDDTRRFCTKRGGVFCTHRFFMQLFFSLLILVVKTKNPFQILPARPLYTTLIISGATRFLGHVNAET